MLHFVQLKHSLKKRLAAVYSVCRIIFFRQIGIGAIIARFKFFMFICTELKMSEKKLKPVAARGSDSLRGFDV